MLDTIICLLGITLCGKTTKRRRPPGATSFCLMRPFPLCAKIVADRLHTRGLFHTEGAAGIAVAAADAVPGGLFKRQIMLLCQLVAELGQIIILVDECDIQPCGTGVTVAVERLPLGFAPRTLMRSPPCGRIRYSMV